MSLSELSVCGCRIMELYSNNEKLVGVRGLGLGLEKMLLLFFFITFINCQQNPRTKLTGNPLFLPSKTTSSGHAINILLKPKVSIWFKLCDVRKRESINDSHAGH